MEERGVVKILKKVPGMSDVLVDRMDEDINSPMVLNVLGYYSEYERAIKIKMLIKKSFL